jgi:VWFA-related protein
MTPSSATFWPVLITCAGVLLTRGADPQKTTFRSSVDAVVVDVLVTDRGKPVGGLTADDFELRDEGVRQRIELSSTASNVHVILALDASGSVAGDELNHLKRATRALTGALQPGDSASFVSFSRPIRLFALNATDPAVVDRALDSVEAGGRTGLLDALYASIALSAVDAPRSLLLLFSDGGENASWLAQDSVLESLRRATVVVYPIAPPRDTPPIGDRLLGQIAQTSGGQLLHAGADNKLPSVFVSILNEFRARYLLTYMPTGVTSRSRWHRLTVSLKGKSGRVTARPGYFTPQNR